MTTNILFDTMLSTKQNKLNFFQNIVLVAIADRYVDELESEFLLAIGNQLELTEEDTRHIADNLPSLSFIIPQEGLQKHLELQTLVMMTVQDGKVEEREYNLCLEYARQIGYSKEILDNLIKQIM
ncbi:hypothetical protein [Botryobacter ruber]|uniref:hypothetical protein n=1 Tax=Botryobacter ruber TaxID=2171629 RepID=UPI000E0B0FBF|nr:hypothetical protein [Botryobacter ruber]